jgi:hypothetical protein
MSFKGIEPKRISESPGNTIALQVVARFLNLSSTGATTSHCTIRHLLIELSVFQLPAVAIVPVCFN